MSQQLIKIKSVRPATDAERNGVYHLAGRSYKRVTVEEGEITIQHVQEVETLYDWPKGSEIAEHEDTIITCDDCHESFPVSQLQCDELEGAGEDDFFTDTKCPKCGTWNCCALKYESIPEYKARQHELA